MHKYGHHTHGDGRDKADDEKEPRSGTIAALISFAAVCAQRFIHGILSKHAWLLHNQVRAQCLILVRCIAPFLLYR